MKIKCKSIVGGKAIGISLFTNQPINFLSMMDTKTGMIKDSNHNLNGQNLKNRILIFPNAIGSSVGAYTIFSLKKNNVSPAGIICTNFIDIATSSGCAISNIPLVFLDKTDLKEVNLRYIKENSINNFELFIDAQEGYISYID